MGNLQAVLRSLDSDTVENLLQRGREGDKEAGLHLYQYFQKYFRAAIRRVMPKRMKTLFDSDDFLQETILHLATRNLPEQIYETAEGFLRYVRRVTTDQVAQEKRRHLQAKKRNLNQTIPLESALQARFIDPALHAFQTVEQEDEWTYFLGQQTPIPRFVFVHLRRGWSLGQIAKRLGLSPRHLRRMVRQSLLKYGVVCGMQVIQSHPYPFASC